MAEKERVISSKEEEIQQLREQQQEKDQASRQLEERERKLGRGNQQLQEAKEESIQSEKRATELEQLFSQRLRDQQGSEASSRRKEPVGIKLKWREGKRAPCGMYRLCDAVVDGNTVYVRNGRTAEIYSYNATTDSWSHLPDCVTVNGSITVIKSQLTTVGGSSSNELWSLKEGGTGREWTKKYPPMPTKRMLTTVLCTGTALIVAGGVGEGGVGIVLSTVEVMNVNSENHQWSTAADLPRPMWAASLTVCGDCVYVLGEFDKRFVPTESVYTCSVSALLQSCVPTSKTPSQDQASVWRRVADLPVRRSTCESFHGQLLAVGGEDRSRKATTAVYAYSLTTNSWEIISHMATGRYFCVTAVLLSNQLMVVGGETDEESPTNTVELANID